MNNSSCINSTEISNWVIKTLLKIGLHETIIATSLVTTYLWGIDSHGIARIPHYLNRFEQRCLNQYD